MATIENRIEITTDQLVNKSIRAKALRSSRPCGHRPSRNAADHFDLEPARSPHAQQMVLHFVGATAINNLRCRDLVAARSGARWIATSASASAPMSILLRPRSDAIGSPP